MALCFSFKINMCLFYSYYFIHFRARFCLRVDYLLVERLKLYSSKHREVTKCLKLNIGDQNKTSNYRQRTIC